MAELAAGIVGIVAFGVQLIDTANKIRTLCELIRDAPLNIQETVEDIALVADVMVNLAPPSEDDIPEAISMTKAFLLCRTAVNRLTALARDMERLLQRRHFGPIRLAMRKDDIDRVAQRLERCKTLLLLAQQAYTAARCKRQLEVMEYRMQRSLIASINTTVPRLLETVHDNDHSACTRSVSRSLVKVQSRKKKLLSSAAMTLRLRVATSSLLLSPWACQFTLHRTAFGFSPMLHFYRTAPDDDPVFRMCWKDDLAGLRRILAHREANVYDRDQHGRTLFDTAVSYGSTSIARFLSDHGAAVLGDVKRELAPLDCFWISTYNRQVDNARESGQHPPTVLREAKRSSPLCSKSLILMPLNCRDMASS